MDDSLSTQIMRTFEAVAALGDAQRRFAEEANRELTRLWADNAELRDEIHAVANRLENLTRAVTTDPAEVAAGIVNDANRSTLREVRGEET
jgi:hypothetical protein